MNSLKLSVLTISILISNISCQRTTTSTTTTSSALQNTITQWLASNGATGYKGYSADVLNIYYDSSNVYMYSNSIPSYTIGYGNDTWKSNPNKPSPQNVTYMIRRYPQSASTKRANTLGAIGFWKDGVAIYNPNDGNSYNSKGVWYRNAYYWEGVSFDQCYGHADGKGNYHNHVEPICMSGYSTTSTTAHSPLLGFMFDGYPIYGRFGYSSANDSSSSIKRMKSGYSLRSITQRRSFSNGTTFTTLDSYGPDVSSEFPLGSFLEDYEWLSTNGDLDAHNGRWCVTPEYPSGTYAYFVTTTDSGAPAYPFTIGPYYYGTVTDIKSQSSIPSTATKYF